MFLLQPLSGITSADFDSSAQASFIAATRSALGDAGDYCDITIASVTDVTSRKRQLLTARYHRLGTTGISVETEISFDLEDLADLDGDYSSSTSAYESLSTSYDSSVSSGDFTETLSSSGSTALQSVVVETPSVSEAQVTVVVYSPSPTFAPTFAPSGMTTLYAIQVCYLCVFL